MEGLPQWVITSCGNTAKFLLWDTRSFIWSKCRNRMFMASEAILIPTLEALGDIVDTAEDLLTMLAKFYQDYKDEGQLNQFKELLKENREQLTIIKKRHLEVKEMHELGRAAEIKLDVNQLVKNLYQDERFKKYLEYRHAVEFNKYSNNEEGQKVKNEHEKLDDVEAKASSEDVKWYRAEISRLKNEHNKALTALNRKQNEINQLVKQNKKGLNKKNNEANQPKGQKGNSQKEQLPSREEISFLKNQNSKYEKIISQKDEEIVRLKAKNKEYANQIATYQNLDRDAAARLQGNLDEQQHIKDLSQRIVELEQMNFRLESKYKAEVIEEEKLVAGDELPELSYEDFKNTYLEWFTNVNTNYLKIDSNFSLSVDSNNAIRFIDALTDWQIPVMEQMIILGIKSKQENLMKFLKNKWCSKFKNLSLYSSRNNYGYYHNYGGTISYEFSTLDSVGLLEPLQKLLPFWHFNSFTMGGFLFEGDEFWKIIRSLSYIKSDVVSSFMRLFTSDNKPSRELNFTNWGINLEKHYDFEEEFNDFPFTTIKITSGYIKDKKYTINKDTIDYLFAGLSKIKNIKKTLKIVEFSLKHVLTSEIKLIMKKHNFDDIELKTTVFN